MYVMHLIRNPADIAGTVLAAPQLSLTKGSYFLDVQSDAYCASLCAVW